MLRMAEILLYTSNEYTKLNRIPDGLLTSRYTGLIFYEAEVPIFYR